ncbi:mercuric reductase [bacterium BMS3Abin07]|nr:mercuric reductase [bacterium BMS3Abin07]GBE33450.1 mercuric reductase [bacterium BMS3Bbin05]HDO22321.1 FAD-dependent oxidoreductase [Nitrospirota bacterium]HDZ88680.1 FAD-dependent oxidoreductase [Nitrospirota bacterium]
MAKYDYDIGILGGGAAGLTVAAGAAQLGAKTLLVEKEKKLGGDCLHFGCVPSKTLIKTAAVYRQIKNAEKYGLPGVDVPPVDYRDIAHRIQGVIDIIQKHDSEERFCSLGARVEFGNPAFTDEHTISLNGKNYSAKSWVIATGSSPDIPPVEGLDKTPYITNKEIFSLNNLPKSMIVLGAGPIAIEMAQAFCRLGTNVTVVQRSGQILSKEDKDMADIVMEVLKAEGVKFHLNSKVVSVSDPGSESEVRILSGDRQINLRAETILVALGREANLGGMNLENIGVEFDKKGLRVNNRLRTTQKHIYAAGDVTGANQFTHAAGYEGGVVVTNAIFHLPRRVDYTYLPWCTYSEPELASIGMNEKRARAGGLEYSVWTEEFKANDRALAEGEGIGRIKLLLDSEERPLGVQILGLHGGELVSEWVAALSGKVKLSTIAAAVHPYPTLGEINRKVAGALLSKKIFSEKVRKGLKFFFNFKGRACG